MTWYQSSTEMAWRPPTASMVRQSTGTVPPLAPQTEGENRQAIPNSSTSIPTSTSLLASIPGLIFDPNDLTNLLYLHPNESPAQQLVTAQLEGRSNYHPWARAMEMALISKNKLSLVNGTMIIPCKLDLKYFY